MVMHLKNGTQVYISKPSDPEEAITIIREHLGDEFAAYLEDKLVDIENAKEQYNRLYGKIEDIYLLFDAID